MFTGIGRLCESIACLIWNINNLFIRSKFMTQDLEKYHDIINQLKPFVNEPDFSKVLSQVGANIPKQKRFLLKMELKRLARPCNRVIDLRGRVDGECSMYEFAGITHFVDDIAREVFDNEIKVYGTYTLGVYEAVNNTENNFRVMHQKERDQIAQGSVPPSDIPPRPVFKEKSSKEDVYFVPAYDYVNFKQRSEERMNFAVGIELFSDTNKSIMGTTVDLSVSGLQFKTEQKDPFKTGDLYKVFFRGLENEYALDKRNGIPYAVVKIETSENEQRVGLRRVEDRSSAYFKTFLEQFIRGNKRRYKVNIDNTLQAIKNKSYEQYYIPSFTSVPLYVEQIDNRYYGRFLLTNDSNKSSIFYWNDEHGDLSLGYMVNSKRLTTAIKKGVSSFYIYAFNNVSNDKVFFYSVADVELPDDGKFLKIFQGFASKKASWRMYKVQLSPVTADQCYRPLSLPNDIGDNVRKENQPPPPRLLAKLKHLSHVALITDVTDESSTLIYQQYPVSKAHLQLIKKFGHSKTEPPEPVSLFRFKYQNLRVESRYQLRTPVTIAYTGAELHGITDDVSPGGLCIELQSPFKGGTFSIVEASFPKLQGLTRKFQLESLPYEVRNISKDGRVINLKTFQEEGGQKLPIATQFFGELIKNNRNKLRADRDEEEFPGMGEALKNIYANNVQNIAFFFKKEGIHVSPAALSRPVTENRLMKLFSFGVEDEESANLYPLFCAPGVDAEYVPNTLKDMRMSNKPIARELYISFDPTQNSQYDAIKGVFADTLEEQKQHADFIKQANAVGEFFALKVFVARTGRPDTDLLRLEMSYVNMYAQHKAKTLEQGLWEVMGVGDVIDITDEVLRRLGLQPKKNNEEEKAKADGKSALAQQAQAS